MLETAVGQPLDVGTHVRSPKHRTWILEETPQVPRPQSRGKCLPVACTR